MTFVNLNATQKSLEDAHIFVETAIPDTPKPFMINLPQSPLAQPGLLNMDSAVVEWLRLNASDSSESIGNFLSPLLLNSIPPDNPACMSLHNSNPALPISETRLINMNEYLDAIDHDSREYAPPQVTGSLPEGQTSSLPRQQPPLHYPPTQRHVQMSKQALASQGSQQEHQQPHEHTYGQHQQLPVPFHQVHQYQLMQHQSQTPQFPQLPQTQHVQHMHEAQQTPQAEPILQGKSWKPKQTSKRPPSISPQTPMKPLSKRQRRQGPQLQPPQWQQHLHQHQQPGLLPQSNEPTTKAQRSNSTFSTETFGTIGSSFSAESLDPIQYAYVPSKGGIPRAIVPAPREYDDCDSICDSNCGSACTVIGPCPSECGDISPGVCCDDDFCASAPPCQDQACQDASWPCNDETCLAQSMPPQPQHQSHVMTDSDRDAAAALASFGFDNAQLLNFPAENSQNATPNPLSHHFGALPSSFYLPTDIQPCSNFSLDFDWQQAANSLAVPSALARPEIALANHILGRHDSHDGLALRDETCLANNPSQLIKRCRLPKGKTQGRHADVDAPECGYELQSPRGFVHHMFSCHDLGDFQHQESSCRANDESTIAHAELEAAQIHRGSAAGYSATTQASSGQLASSSDSYLGRRSESIPHSTTPSPLAAPLSLKLQNTSAEVVRTSPAGDSLEVAQPQLAEPPRSHTCQWRCKGHEDVCGKVFGSAYEAHVHVKEEHIAHMEKINGGFYCGWEGCDRAHGFTQKSKVERHLQKHTNFKPVQCSICNLRLSAPQSLIQHMRTHTGESPWVCKHPGCGQSFKQQSAMTMHMRTHSGHKPLECPICKKRFSESSNLSKHRRTHSEHGMHVCKICGKEFHRLDQLRRHLPVAHDDKEEEVATALAEAMQKSRNPTAGARAGRRPKMAGRTGSSEVEGGTASKSESN